MAYTDYAVYGVHFYNTALYGIPPVFEFVLPKFEARPVGFDTVAVEWANASGNWDQLRLVRGTYGFPADERDGKILVDSPNTGAPGSHQDQAVSPLRFYYYSIFLRVTTTGQWRRAGNAVALVPGDHGYADRLEELVPQVFRDEYPDGPLRRLLECFGYELEILRSEVESLRWVIEPERVAGGLLKAMARQWGLPYESELGMAFVRRQVLSAVYLWKMKGTRLGVEGAVSVLTGWAPTVELVSPGNLRIEMAADRVNLAVNPSFEVDATWWQVDANAAAPARVDPGVGKRRFGTYVGAMTASAAGDVSWRTPGGTAGMPVVAGRLYTGSIDMRGATTARDVQLLLNWFNAAGAYLSTAQGEIANDAAWARPSVSAVSPTGAARCQIVLKVRGTLAGEVHWVDGALFEAGALAGYFDADPAVPTNSPIADYMPEGTPHLSRTHYYHRRAIKNSRLLVRLPDFLPAGMAFDTFYAQPPDEVVRIGVWSDVASNTWGQLANNTWGEF